MIRAYLHSEFGSFKAKSVRIKESLNGPVDWSASLVDHLPGYMEMPDSTEFRIEIDTYEDNYLSPPLVCLSPSREISLSVKSGTLGGIDKATWMASKDDLSLDTFKDSSTTAIVSQCFSTVGIEVLGLIFMPIPEDDVKNSKVLDVLTRYLEFTGQDYFVTREGKIQCLPVSYIGPVVQLRYARIGDTISHASRVDSIKIEKTSKISGDGEICFTFDSPGFKTVQLPRPLYRAHPIDRSAYGYISHVTTFNNGTGGTVTGFFQLQSSIPVNVGGIDMALPSTHASLVVNQPLTLIGTQGIDAKVCFVGNPQDLTPPNQPIEVARGFRRQISVNSARPARNIWSDNLMPSSAWVSQYGLEYLISKNKSYHPMSALCPLSIWVSLGQSFTYPGMPVAKIESFEHNIDVANSTATTSIDGYVPWPQGPVVVTTF